jgi:hypothetical protein
VKCLRELFLKLFFQEAQKGAAWMAGRDDIDVTMMEVYLSDADFQKVFSMSKVEAFFLCMLVTDCFVRCRPSFINCLVGGDCNLRRKRALCNRERARSLSFVCVQECALLVDRMTM